MRPAAKATPGQAVRIVLRGGAFNNNRNNARAAVRNRNHTDNRNNNNGFRVACAHTLL